MNSEQPGIPLTTELAKNNLDQYKGILIEKFKSDPKRKKLLERLYTSKILPWGESFPIVNLDTNKWQSNINEHRQITIGTQDMESTEPGLRAKLLHEGKSYSYEDQILHILTHEVSHAIPALLLEDPDLPSEFKDLKAIIIEVREANRIEGSEHGTRGLTAIGSYEGKNGKWTKHQALEDIIDLFALYLTKPILFDKFIRYLKDPSERLSREERGLAEMDVEQIDLIAKKVKNIIDKITDKSSDA